MSELLKPNLYDKTVSSEAEVSRYFVDMVGLQSRMQETSDASTRALLYKGIAALVGELINDASSVEAQEYVASAFVKLAKTDRPSVFGAVRYFFLRSTNLGQAEPFDSKRSTRQARAFLGLNRI